MDINEIFLREREILFRDLDFEETERQTSRSLERTESSKNFKLVVPSSHRPVYCSKKVIDSSSLLRDMLEYVNDEDPRYGMMTCSFLSESLDVVLCSPIPVPEFISRQIVLDWVEIVEKEDTECAHLGMKSLTPRPFVMSLSISVLVSLSYLLDFLIAVDFLGCEDIKSSVEEKIKEKIDESNWVEVFKYTKGIMGLETTTKHALEHLMAKIVKFYSEADQLKTVEDPFTAEYVGMAPAMIKLLLKSHKCCENVKFKVINQWVIQNGFPFDQVAVFDLLKQVKFKDLQDCDIKMITMEVTSWNISEEQLSIFTDLVDEAKKERDAENEMRKKMRHNEKVIFKQGIHLRIQRHLGLGIGFAQYHMAVQHNGHFHIENHPPQPQVAAGPAIGMENFPPALLHELEEDEMLNVEDLF